MEKYVLVNNVMSPKVLNVEEANKIYGKAEWPEHEGFDDDLHSVLECEKCGCVYEYDPFYMDCPNCNNDKRKEETGKPLYVYV